MYLDCGVFSAAEGRGKERREKLTERRVIAVRGFGFLRGGREGAQRLFSAAVETRPPVVGNVISSPLNKNFVPSAWAKVEWVGEECFRVNVHGRPRRCIKKLE